MLQVILSASLALGLAAPSADSASRSAVVERAPSVPAPGGLYIECRSASVYAGACHYNSELMTAGGEALLAWSFEAGVHQGVDLTGVRVAALAVADRNLVLEGARTTSAIYVDGGDAEARAAAVRLVRERHAEALGRVRSVAREEVAIEHAGERYAVRIGARTELEGELLPDRACCSMPLLRWYEPFSTVETAVVGNSTRFAHAGDRWIERTWRRSGHNDAQVARFAW